jgi:hypothetical protein
LENLLVIAFTLAAGLGLRQLLRERADDAAQALNTFVIYVALPAVILVAIPRLTLTSDTWLLVATPWLTLAVSALLVLIAARRFAWSRPTTGALLLVVPLGNTSFLGIPLTAAWFGPDATPLAVVYDQLGSFLALTLYGTAVISRYAPLPPPAASPDAAPPPPAPSTARRIATFPPFIALLLALAATALPNGWPPALESAFTLIGQSLVPTVMVAIGLQWKLALDRSDLAQTAFALVAKLAVAPAVAALLVVATHAEGLAAQVSVLEAGMGPMITAGALASAAGLAPRLVAGIIGYGTLLSLGTTAIIALLLATR